MSKLLTEKILQNYADLMVNFAANERKGVQAGEVVFVRVMQSGLQMLKYFQRSILKAGAIPIFDIIPEGLSRDYFELANDEQLSFVADKMLRARMQTVDHTISMIGSANPLELEGIKTEKMKKRTVALTEINKEMTSKFDSGEITWTLALFGTEGMAKQAGLSLDEYWEQIIHACFLDDPNPVERFREIFGKIDKVSEWLNNLNIQRVHMYGEDCDIEIGIGSNRKWVGGSGHNIPSFEIFTSPDFRDVNGWIQFNQPLLKSGQKIEDIRLEFVDGKVSKASASKNQEALEEMLSHKGANMLGEFSMTDARFSRITKFMANTLYDENVGGEFGNSHVAVGNAYKSCYKGDFHSVEPEKWLEMGYNESVIHTDIVTTTNRTVKAFLDDGSELIIYENGRFTLELE